MYFGKKQGNNQCDDPNTDTDRSRCNMNGFDRYEFEHFKDCNGEFECEDAAIPVWISNCNTVSDFLHIDYQCIEGKFYL